MSITPNKPSLSDVLHSERIAIEDHEKIVIDRIEIKSMTESAMKRAKLSHQSTLNSPAVDLKGFEALSWKDKINKVIQLKDEDIEDLENQLKLVNQRSQLMIDYIKTLEGQLQNAISSHGNNNMNSTTQIVQALQAQFDKIQDDSNLKLGVSNNNSTTTSVPTLTDDESKKKIQSLEKIIKFYEYLTSCKVRMPDEQAADSKTEKFLCTRKNSINRSVIKFLMYDNPENDQESIFVPKANMELFPAYLQGEILFESKMAPVILGDLLQALYEDKDQNENGEEGNEQQQ